MVGDGISLMLQLLPARMLALQLAPELCIAMETADIVLMKRSSGCCFGSGAKVGRSSAIYAKIFLGLLLQCSRHSHCSRNFFILYGKL